MRPRFKGTGFSLIEVILAVGIFALTVPTMLALLAALGRQGAAGADAQVAQRLPDAVRVELARLAQADFDGLSAHMPEMSASLPPALELVATRDGVRVHSRDYLPPTDGIAAADQYFLIECWRFHEGPLRFDSSKAFLAVVVRVSWPYRLPDGGTTAAESRSQVRFTVVLNR